MKQLFIIILFTISLPSYNYAQSSKKGCPKIGLEATASKISLLENPNDYPNDSIIFQFPDTISNGINYIYLINRSKKSVFFKSSRFFVPDIIQEALDSNGNWIAIENIITVNDCMPPSLDYISPNHYVAFGKSFYTEGNFCTKIRFKVIGPYESYYSQSYDGCINYCLVLPYFKSEIWRIYNSDKSNKEKIKWFLDNWKEEKAAQYTTMLISLYIKSSDFASASLYADQLIEILPESGRGYLYKGDVYSRSANHCFPNNIFLKKAIINLAFEEWKKAKRFEDVKERAEERFRQYQSYLLTKEEYPELAHPHNNTIHIGCWINRTVTVE